MSSRARRQTTKPRSDQESEETESVGMDPVQHQDLDGAAEEHPRPAPEISGFEGKQDTPQKLEKKRKLG